MALQTFTPPVAPSPGTTSKPTLKLWRADFGDGYTQTTRAGLNHQRGTLELRWDVLTGPQAAAIKAFFEAHGGDTPFLYALPGDAFARKWTCDEWDWCYLANGYQSVAATIKQNFSITS